MTGAKNDNDPDKIFVPASRITLRYQCRDGHEVGHRPLVDGYGVTCTVCDKPMIVTNAIIYDFPPPPGGMPTPRMVEALLYRAPRAVDYPDHLRQPGKGL